MAHQNLSIPHAVFALVRKRARTSPDAGPTAASFSARAATSVAFMHSAPIDAMISVSVGLCKDIQIYVKTENSTQRYLYIYI